MKILLAVDGSPYTKKMLAYLATHIEMFGAGNRFTLLNVQLPLPPRARAAVGADVAKSYHDEEAAKVFGPVTKFLKRHGVDAETISKVGHPGELIAKTADSGKFDMVVMGSHGHSALGNLVMGSVATKVMAHCGTPVLLVR
ncbi:universal stress protein [Hydrogenophaga sp. OTU3427]|uniref:universal stress protein n=1 Tax=Hydrogenophaga sp. OTU3427 TaxID=3043856 RepID=UPI00313D382E